MMRLRVHLWLAAMVVAATALARASAPAQDSAHDRTHFGSDITVAADEEVGDVTCFGCSVRVRGHASGDVTVFGGTVTIESKGDVDGDLTSFAGNVALEDGSEVDGDVAVFGGRVRRDPGATVDGDVTNFRGTIWAILIFGLPLVIFGAFIALIIWVIRRVVSPSRTVTA
jgi:cytoskeletal protein CcmA (bactofilin family)